MSELEEILKYGTFVGIVEDNEDPDKKQRVRIRIPFLHGKSTEIPTEALPWAQPFRDMNGLTCVIPDTAKIVNVTFPWGNAYYPVYNSAEHLNINLQKKLEEYSGEDYTNFIALLYNHNTQIYVDNQKGLFIRHKFNEINLTEDGISLNLKDNSSTLFIGDDKGDQEALLATHFMEWFDTLMQTLMNAYIGNLGAPVIANPNLINVFTNYQAKRSTFLSKHVYITDNNKIKRDKLTFEDKKGDEIEQSVKSSKVTVTNKPIKYTPKPVTEEKGIAEVNDYKAPISDKVDRQENTGVVTSDTNDEVNKLIRYLQSKGFKYSSKKYELNIVGIRNKLKDDGIISNKFDDTMYVFYVNEDNKWELNSYKCTTTPGFAPKLKQLPNDNAATMAYGQFVNQYKIGYHQNRTGKTGGKVNIKTGELYPEHKCLKFANTGFFRQPSGSDVYITQKDAPVVKGSIGLNIHHALEKGVTTDVYNFSEGCQVFASRPQHDQFMQLCEQQVEKTSIGSFTYALIPQRDYDNFS